MKDKVRVGIVGSKFAADFHCDAYSRMDNAEVVAVAELDNLEQVGQSLEFLRAKPGELPAMESADRLIECAQ